MKRGFPFFIKRLFDIFSSSIAIIILSPIFLICAILIIIDLGRPIFFKQDRIGKGNKKFKIIKFRTMKELRNEEGKLLDDSLRLSKVGKIIRRLSIDELPQLLNVVKGDMSLVGPRPLLPKYLSLYSKKHMRRHEVLPGITGWAQVNGRNNISWLDKFDLDIYYIDNWSIWLDVKILFITVYKVINRDGINKDGCETTEEFNGIN